MKPYIPMQYLCAHTSPSPFSLTFPPYVMMQQLAQRLWQSWHRWRDIDMLSSSLWHHPPIPPLLLPHDDNANDNDYNTQTLLLLLLSSSSPILPLPLPPLAPRDNDATATTMPMQGHCYSPFLLHNINNTAPSPTLPPPPCDDDDSTQRSHALTQPSPNARCDVHVGHRPHALPLPLAVLNINPHPHLPLFSHIWWHNNSNMTMQQQQQHFCCHPCMPSPSLLLSLPSSHAFALALTLILTHPTTQKWRRDNTTTMTTTLLPLHDNVIIVIATPILACLCLHPHPHPYMPDNTEMVTQQCDDNTIALVWQCHRHHHPCPCVPSPSPSLFLTHLTIQKWWRDNNNNNPIAWVWQCCCRHCHSHPCPHITTMTATCTVPVGIPVLGYTLG